MARARTWTEVYVGPRCSVQTSNDRFGPGADRAIRAALEKVPYSFADPDEWLDDEEEGGADSDSDDGAPEWFPDDEMAEAADGSDDVQSNASSEPTDFPKVARTRMNLTALSQQYDLYFAAYRDKIYVYRPRAGPEILKQQPELVLQPAASFLARHVAGQIDRRKPHQVDHLIVGNLGDSEILLMCYDDGDVIAYYTHLIAKYVLNCASSPRRRPSVPPRTPKPFFHESVGVSAWGLAIHSRSRLIAVSSNMHEVTVFSFALRSAERRPGKAYLPGGDRSPRTNAGLTAMELEEHLRSRDRYWRIVLPLSEIGNNVPNISFWDDERGEAEKVAAVDINGYCWLLDIWKVGSHPVNILVPGANFRNMGWGVLVLPTSFFLPTETLSQALGTAASSCIVTPRAGGGVYVNISRSLENAHGNPVRDFAGDPLMEMPRPPPPPGGTLPMPGVMRAAAAQTLQDIAAGDASEDESDDCEDGESSEDDFDEDLAERWRAVQPPEQNHSQGGEIDLMLEERRPLSICPGLGLTDSFTGMLSHVSAHARRSKTVLHGLTVARESGSMRASAASRLAILRTFEVSVELLTTDPGDASVICHNLLATRHARRAPGLVWDMHLGQRMSMLHAIPELSVVLVGSLSGRVAILRLTRPPRPSTGSSPLLRAAQVRRAFRVEWVLPRADEERRGLRPNYCLLGMAVSREPEPGAPGLHLSRAAAAAADGAARDTEVYPKRWRLMLHYTEHTILQYTLELADPLAGDLALSPI